MKKMYLVPLCVLVAVVILLAGCAQQAPTSAPKPSPAPASTPAPKAPVEVIKLKFAHAQPPQSTLGVALNNWAKKIGTDSGGKVEITVFPAESLIPAREFYDATVTGVTDITYGNLNNAMEHFAIETGYGLPGLSWPQSYPDVKVRLNVLAQLRQKFPEVQQARKDVEVMFDTINPPYIFHSPKKVVRKPADIKGLQVAASGFTITMAKVLGAIPVTLTSTDKYLALERGTVDGAWDIWSGIDALKLIEVSNNYYQGDFFGNSLNIVVMNKIKFNALPPDIQKVFRDNAQYGTDQTISGMYSPEGAAIQKVKDRGGKIFIATPEEQELWGQALSPMHSEWVKEQTGRGLPAQAYLDEMLRLIKSSK